MGSKQGTVDYIIGQIANAGNVYYKKMFGEYGIFLDDKMIALVCDDQLFVKITEAGRAFLPDAEEGQPYPGAKPCFLIPEDQWDDFEWMTELILITAPELVPVKKKGKKKKE